MTLMITQKKSFKRTKISINLLIAAPCTCMLVRDSVSLFATVHAYMRRAPGCTKFNVLADPLSMLHSS